MDELHEAGRTLVLITHDTEVASAAGRVLGIRDGLITENDRPELGERPMSWLETFRTGLNGVRSHRLRSGLTVLGILIGIAAVILTVGLGEGAQGQVRLGDHVTRDQPPDRHPRGARPRAAASAAASAPPRP